MTSLGFPLADYLIHDVHEEVPFMLLELLEAIDLDRIGIPVESSVDYVKYIVALLPEDAQAFDESYPRIAAISESFPTSCPSPFN